MGLLGILVILALAYLLSSNRKKINYRIVCVGLLIQISLCVLTFKVAFTQRVFAGFAHIVERVLSFYSAGAEFVFGPLVNVPLMGEMFGGKYGFIFFFNVTSIIIFIAVLVSIAYHFGIMQRIVSLIAKGVYKLMPVSGSEALSNVGSAFVGQVEAQIMIKPYLLGMTRSELLASMTGSMACISGAVMGAYIAMGIPATYLLAASMMAIPGGLLISKMLIPETETSETQNTVTLNVQRSTVNVLDAVAHGATDGLSVSLNVAAMLIGFLGLIALSDFLLEYVGIWLYRFTAWDWTAVGIDLQHLKLKQIAGFFFSSLAFLMGVPSQDVSVAGQLMGTKFIVNEFVAYADLTQLKASLDPKTLAIVSFALCGFANLSSVAIQVGGIGKLVPSRQKDIAKLGMKALVGGTLASYLSASIIGILL